MGNSTSRDDDDRDSDERRRPDEDVVVRPEPAPLPVEPHTDPNIVENLERPLDDDKFNMGVSSNYREVRASILKKSEESGTQYVWRDTDFPASDESLYFSRYAPAKWRNLEWKRPYEISKHPRLLKDGTSTDDIIQGSLGNCWWLSSVGAIARKPHYMARLIPGDQVLTGDKYAGLFHFRFWRFGSWVDVIVDDRLPTKYGRLVMGRSADDDEFWLPFMEKAYAKLHGSYEAIEGGFAQDALEDLTGGMAVSFDLGSQTPNHLFKSLVKALHNKSFACCSITGSGETEDKTTGLVSAHAYTVTGAKRIPYKGATAKLVRIRNPWGNKVEWKGKWSDHSRVWNEVDSSVRSSLEYADEDNGEWWMEFDDFKYYFNTATICTMGPDFDSDGAPTGDSWFLSKAKGVWIKNESAGGCRNDVHMYATNPQYLLELREPDDFDPSRDEPEQRGKCSVVMGLMQEYRRVGRKDGLENLYLSINVYKLKSKPRGRLSVDHFRYNRDHVDSGTYINKREVSITTELDPGYYAVIPSTYYPDKSGSFLLRIFTEKRIDLKELL